MLSKHAAGSQVGRWRRQTARLAWPRTRPHRPATRPHQAAT